MKTALRMAVCVVGLAAAPYAANAMGPMSNGAGDGEANVPFASLATGADGSGGGGSDRAESYGSREGREQGKAAGRSARAARRGRTAGDVAAPAPTPAPDAEDNGALKELIWTAP